MKEFSTAQDKVMFLRQLFGDNRAEWPTGTFRELFVPPSYMKKLQAPKPSLLVGGRGTGKTTALQSLRYEETLTRLMSDGRSFSDQQYLGILIRMNKNRVHAFKGSSLNEEQWGKAFAHYINLIISKEINELAIWLEEQTEQKLSSDEIRSIANDLGLKQCDTLYELDSIIRQGVSELQLFVNNPHVENVPIFSIAESPLRVFVESLDRCGFLGGRLIFCCIDEYENLLDYQQAVLNTYIKHAEPPLSYKVGVRKYGLRNFQTLDINDSLRNPEDFGEINISDEGFELFATEVANKRLKFAREKSIPVPENIAGFLENIRIPEEAILLGAESKAKEVLKELSNSSKEIKVFLSKKEYFELYFLRYWQAKTGEGLEELVKEWISDEDTWKTRIGNHGYASLFWLTKGKKGIRIRKYYSGITAILSLSGENIRYFLELIDSAIAFELRDVGDKFPEQPVLSAKSQTLSLREVGKRRLDQLEGLAENGVKLKRLVLAIGKVFFELARTPANRSPEVNSFVLKGSANDVSKIYRLLKDGVGYLAFESSPRTKDTTNLELQDDEFRLHRIFTGFFEISYRKKRRTEFDASDLLEAVNGKPSDAIASLLASEDIAPDEELPEQLAFFSTFYDEDAQDE